MPLFLSKFINRPVFSIRLRWVWGSVYAIAGMLALTRFFIGWQQISLDGHTYLAFGLAAFVGGLFAARQSTGSSLAEGILAALCIGLLQETFIIYQAPVDSLKALEQVAAPLSFTFISMVGALAGGRVGEHWKAKERETLAGRLSLTALAAITLVGAFATHTWLIILVDHVHNGLAIALGFCLMLGAPTLAGAAMQLMVKQPVERFFAGGLGLMLTALFAGLLFEQGGFDLIHLIIMGVSTALALLTLLLVLPGSAMMRNAKAWTRVEVEVPAAVARAKPDTQP